MGFGKAVQVLLGGYVLPTFEVEWHLDERGVGDVYLLIDATHIRLKLLGATIAPNRRQGRGFFWEN